MTVSTSTAAADPAEIVRTFLESLEAGEIAAASALLAEDVEYTNVSLPTLRGRARVERTLRFAFVRLGLRFRVHFHNLAADGTTVLTERTDGLAVGRVEQVFWVYGRFEVRDGLISVWRDSFDWLDITVSLIRGCSERRFPVSTAAGRRAEAGTWRRSSARRIRWQR